MTAEEQSPTYSQSLTLPAPTLGITSCQRNSPVFSSKHINTARSRVSCGARGASLFVPTNPRPPETTGLPYACEPSFDTQRMFLVDFGSIVSVLGRNFPLL